MILSVLVGLFGLLVYHRPGRAVPVVASAAVRHGNPAADNGLVGSAVKTRTPPQDRARADLDLIDAGEAYNLVIKDVIDVPLAGLEAAVKGSVVFIDPDDNALALAQAGNNVALGTVTELASERGGPANRLRVDLNEKG